MTITYNGTAATPVFVAGVFNDAWALALTKSDAATAATQNAIDQAANPVQMTAGGLSYTPLIPIAPTVTPYDPTTADSRYQTYRADIINFLTQQFTGFITTYFPTSAYLTYAQTWIEKALSTGGTGMAAGIEAQIWERDRARLIKDTVRATDEIISTWANRGYPLPPGAAAGQVLRIQQDLLDKTSAASRDVAIKQAELEVENIRFAVTNALGLRTIALNAAGDYIKTLAMGPQLGVQAATGIADVQARMIGATTEMYRAQVSAAELPLRAKTTDAELRQRAAEANLRSANEAQHDRVAAAAAAASALGSIAASAVNSLHASASVSGSEQI